MKTINQGKYYKSNTKRKTIKLFYGYVDKFKHVIDKIQLCVGSPQFLMETIYSIIIS